MCVRKGECAWMCVRVSVRVSMSEGIVYGIWGEGVCLNSGI